MRVCKVRHGKRYTSKTLADGNVTCTSVQYKADLGLVCDISITMLQPADPSEAIHEGYTVSLTGDELRKMLARIEIYEKHFNGDGSVEP